ncbi:MAG: hypothetical protein D8M57_01700 [Candidatus Scalindua sp. AMX11]|nr:MAG: hypothetical protein DWQ00_15685 [Candidatus Scalindua sp.]NOG85103.1 hypothetical protein [Planctomycetota bacterium]RZV69314.1 MAG: hypothetical protein EX341_16125 [Candidatus Scalindua sp. SCAELEC01]TDE66773.1 MAG: hypothetical protein D8M57_01700 [Candidatus Scalindua sp. AMX11]GJQ60391.1 MAG: hypothetical protein SCALA701_31920 [Candidatus Scalindua sp.]
MYQLIKSRRKFAFVSLCLVFFGCSHSPYRYNFSLIEPKSDAMSFEDEKVQFELIPSSENISVSIENNSDHEISFVRDNAQFIDATGKSYRVHYGNDYVDEVLNYINEYNRNAPRIKIAPNSGIDGYVWINDWQNATTGEGASTHPITSHTVANQMVPLFPRYSFEGSGEDLKNSTFSLILPIDFDGQISNYRFKFMIDDVEEKKDFD